MDDKLFRAKRFFWLGSGLIVSLLTVNTATAATSTDDNVTATTGVQATFDVLANDTGVGALTLVAPNAWSLHGGSVSLVNNQLTYTSSAGYTGDDRIWYTFSDSLGNSNFGQVNITVTNGGNPVGVDDNVTATTGVQATFDVLANDTGVGALTLVAPNAWSLHGGSVSLVNNQLTYTSSAGYTGDDRIWYTFSDSQGNSNYGQVNITVTSSASWYKPTPLTTWQWQLQGTLNTSYNVEMYDIDLFDTDSSKIAELQGQGRKVICYFSGGTYEDWRSDESLFPLTVRGNSLADDGWLGERWLDIRSPTVKNIMVQRLQLAKNKGCDGVEPDNVDGYTNNPGFPLTYSDQIEYNKFLATEAHALGLSIGLKNDLDQIKDLVNDFDFAVNEECHFYEECEYSDQLNLFIDQGKAVFNAEYTFREGDNLATVCAKSNSLSFSTLVLPLSLDDSSRDSCLAN